MSSTTILGSLTQNTATSTFAGLNATYINDTGNITIGGNATTATQTGITNTGFITTTGNLNVGSAGVGSLTANQATSTFAGVSSGFITSSNNITSTGRITSGQQLTVEAGGANITGDVSITGSTTVGTVLNVNQIAGTSTFAGFININGQNSTSTFLGGLTAQYLNQTGTAATNTFANGIRLTNGCFQMPGGECAGTGGGSGTVQSGIANRLAYYPSTDTQVNDADMLYWNNTLSQFAVGTTSPFTNAVLTVEATSTAGTAVNSIPLVIKIGR